MNKERKLLAAGMGLLLLFVVWTLLVQIVDVKPAGAMGTDVGFATVNLWFHQLTGVHMSLYHITDWLGLVPIGVCMVFGGLGTFQLFTRKSFWKTDRDLRLLGVYYLAVIAGYLLFEMIPINYRPVLIEGRLEASYPSSTTLLVLGVMPTLYFQAMRRMTKGWGRSGICMAAVLFSFFMVAGRLLSGVHWVTDIVGAGLLAGGLFLLYQALVLYCDSNKG